MFINLIYTSTVIAFNIAAPWRKNYYTNLPLMFITVVILTYSSLIALVPDCDWRFFKMTSIVNQNLRRFCWGIGVAFGLFIIIFQKCVLEPTSLKLKKKYTQYKWL